MSELFFSNTSSGNTSLYFANLKGQFWCGFLLPENEILQESSILFRDTVKYSGFYLFANAAPRNSTDFVRKSWDYFKSKEKQYQAGGIAWITDIEETFSEENVQLICLQKEGDEIKLLRNFNYNFGNQFAEFAILSMNTKIALDCENNRLLLSKSDDGFIIFKTNESSNMLPYGKLEIPLTGVANASMRFLVGLDHGCDFNAFDTSLKFFYRNDDVTDLQEMNYPIFKAISNERINLQVSINPLDILNKQKLNTYLAFLGTTTTTFEKKIVDTVLFSTMKSDFGVPINLVPKVEFSTCNGSENIPSGESALIIFSERVVDSSTNRWYAIPSGYFMMAVTDDKEHSCLDANNQLRILCGLSGLESISVTVKSEKSEGDWIIFKGKQSAYVIEYPILKAKNKVGSSSEQVFLDKRCVTAWAGIVKNASSKVSVVYHSQPQGSSLFSKQSKNDSDPFLNYYAANSGTLSYVTKTINFPIAVYDTLTTIPDKVNAIDFELQILAPMRKITIDKALSQQAVNRVEVYAENRSAKDFNASSLIESVSPQGFFIKVSEQTSTWTKMQLASNQFISSGGSLSSIYTLEFENLNATLQSAFQTNQLFLVVSSNVDKVLDGFRNEMQLEDWPFNLKVPELGDPSIKNGQYKNIIIFKYCSQTLLERVQNTQLWTNPESFNDTSINGLANLSDWMSNYIQKGIDKSDQGDADYSKFKTIATDPNWRGVIALKVDISLETFPTELQGLLAGINIDNFSAHHFGIDLSIVKNEGGNLGMKPNSSMFALIDYEDPIFRQYNSNVAEYKKQAPVNTYVDYQFNVLLLKVKFSNSKIVNFNSYVAFTINTLFEEKVKSDNRANLLVLNGSYENHNGVPSYTFNSEGENLLYLESAIINCVEILKATFVTSVSQNEHGKGKVESLFSFFGYMDFHPLDGFDLLSFGNEANSNLSGQGIAFSNMHIGLNFPLNTPTSQTYNFDIKKMSYDIGSSYARKGSLYRHFPLQLIGMVSGTKDDNPTTQGFLNVQLPALKQQQNITGDWYGLTFKLNMGSLGALASGAGFNVIFMTPWNVGGTGAVAGLKLPGVNPQAPALSLQGILKLNISSLQINVADTQAGEPDDKVSYLMKMNNISLKFLSLTFPSSGQFGFFLFGNPSETAPPESLGWYAGYVKKK